MTQVLIIEDEVESSRYLEELLTELDDIKILGVLSSIDKTLNWFSRNTDDLDLIFMDVQLSDGISFEIFNELKINCPIIFITAFNEFALKAIKHSSLDYLLKPVTELELSKALIKYYSNKMNTYQPIDTYSLLTSNKVYKEHFLVKEGNHFLPIKIEDIAYIYWSEYAFIKKSDGKSYITNYSISQIEEMLPPHLFIRINRQILTNINAIESLIRDGKSYFINLLPRFSESIKISQESYSTLKKRFS